MKTTLDIADPIFQEAKEIAARERRSLRSVFEEGLSLLFESRQSRKKYRLPDITYGGKDAWLDDDVKDLKQQYRYNQSRELKD